MTIFGIGTDIVSVDRIKSSLENKNFLIRIFNEKEIKRCKRVKGCINCLAKRFAAKEAYSSASTGISNGINFNEIVILNKNQANHILRYYKTKKILKKFKGKRSKVSLPSMKNML